MGYIDVHYDRCLAGVPLPGDETILQTGTWQDFYEIPFVEYGRLYFNNDINDVLFTLFSFSIIIQKYEPVPGRIFFEISIYHG